MIVTDSLLSYCDPGAHGSQAERLKVKQPEVVLLKITGVGVRLVTFSIRVVSVTAGVRVAWLTTKPEKEGHNGIYAVSCLKKVQKYLNVVKKLWLECIKAKICGMITNN